MEDYEFEKFMKTAELCAKEVLGVFEPDILRKIELMTYDLSNKKQLTSEEKEIEIIKIMDSFKEAHDTDQTKYINSCPSLVFSEKSFVDINKLFVDINITFHHGGKIIIIILFIYFIN